MTLFVALMLPVVLGLSVWQLQRAAEKSGYEAAYYDRLGMLPDSPPARPGPGHAFMRIRLRGEFVEGRHYLVDNQVRQGRPGYWIVSEFLATDGRRWLVNRGWLPAPQTREELPPLPTPDGSVDLVAVVWPDTGLVPLLAPDPWPEGWPRRVQRLDVARMAANDPAVVPVEVRLEPGQPGVYAPAPVDVDFSPQRHYGYAFQWFALGVALLIGYLIFALRQPSEPNEQ